MPPACHSLVTLRRDRDQVASARVAGAAIRGLAVNARLTIPAVVRAAWR
jgi:hypothetical protein